MSVNPADVDRSLMDVMLGFANNPLAFVYYSFRWDKGDLAGQNGPDGWQVRQLAEIKRQLDEGAKSLRFATASGHGVGKSALVAWIILWAMSTRPHLAGFVTANTQQQLTDKTWAELSRWHKRVINAHWFEWTATKFAARSSPETWFISAVAWSKEKPEAFAGLHAKDQIIIMDEASAIPDVIWEVAEGAMTSGGFYFAFGNPTRNTGRFRECFGRFSHRWTIQQVDGRTAKMVDQRQVQEWLEDYGEDSDFFRVRVRGVFPRVGDRQFIGTDLAEDAAKREVVIDRALPLIMGVDVARYGDDQSVLAFRRGRDARSIPWRKFRGLATDQLVGMVVEAVNKYQPAAVFVDGGGVGGPVVDFLKAQGLSCLREVNFGGRADRKLAHGGDYANKRAEMWDGLKAWLAGGAIPDDRALIDGMCGCEYGFDIRDRLILEKKEDMKKRGLASPDEADALAMTFAQPVLTAQRKAAAPRFAEMY